MSNESSNTEFTGIDMITSCLCAAVMLICAAGLAGTMVRIFLLSAGIIK